LKEIWITNFKSLRDLRVSLKKFNVIVGPNASGKTNFVEFFKFLRKALVERQRPYVPYLEWWSYRNIVWQRKEELPISAKLKFVFEEFDVEYEVSFSGIGEVFKVLYERLDIPKIISIEKEGTIVRIKHDTNYIKQHSKTFARHIEQVNEIVVKVLERKDRLTIKDLPEQMLEVPSDFRLFQALVVSVPTRKRLRGFRPEFFGTVIGEEEFWRKGALVILPAKEGQRRLLSRVLDSLESAIGKFAVLKHPSMKEVRSSTLTRTQDVLLDDASNLNNILYRWLSEKQRLPERIETTISEIFPDIQIGFQLTYDGRVYMKVYEKGVELDPPCIPDGLYKVLAILTAVELGPSLLAIDEVENSLYKEALEHVIDALRDSGSTVIITTHSPLVVDMVKLEDLLVSEKTAEGTILTRIKEPEKLREKLAELKVTQSESWLYGGLTK